MTTTPASLNIQSSSFKSTDSRPVTGEDIPNPGILHKFFDAAKSFFTEFKEKLSDFPTDKVVKVLTEVAEVASIVGTVVIGIALMPLAILLEPIVKGGALVLLLAYGITYGITYAGVYVADQVYAACNPESNHGTKWSDQYSQMVDAFARRIFG